MIVKGFAICTNPASSAMKRAGQDCPKGNNILSRPLEILFPMHPIATGLTFAVMIITYFINSHDMTIAAFILSLLVGAATFAFAADIASVVVAKRKVKKLTLGDFKIL